MKKLIEQNKEELLKLMKEVNVTNYVENNILEIWAAEIMVCGKRMCVYIIASVLHGVKFRILFYITLD